MDALLDPGGMHRASSLVRKDPNLLAKMDLLVSMGCIPFCLYLAEKEP